MIAVPNPNPRPSPNPNPTQVLGSPATVIAVPGPANAARSHAHGSGLTTVVAGRAAAAVVRACDACGNDTLEELLVTAKLRYIATLSSISAAAARACRRATPSGHGAALFHAAALW